MDSTLDTDDGVLDFLRSWADAPEIETHAARVFLSEDTALKIKRPVQFDFLDFRKLSDRKHVLVRELELNKPNAPMLYQGIVAITKTDDGKIALGGDGEVLEWALQMARFPKENELSAIAERGELNRPIAEALGDMVYQLHAKASVSSSNGADLVAEIIEEFHREFQRLEDEGVNLNIGPVLEDLRSESARLSGLLEDRSKAGYVRRCHGDLHMRNVVLLNGAPVAFDALEFSERFGTCDVLYDLAFLLMDLEVSGHRDAANSVLNEYVTAEADKAALSGLAAMSLFKSVRAVVRAMVAAEQAALSDTPSKLKEAERYIAYARAAIVPMTAKLFAIGGLSGTGKTTLARGVRAELGTIHVRSDVERKRLAGVPSETRLPTSAYTQASSAQTYAEMRERAVACLQSGCPVLLDAVFAEETEREALSDLASDLNVEFRAVWLEAPESIRSTRVTRRTHDASDADATVVRGQSKRDCGHIAWARVTASGDYSETLGSVRNVFCEEMPEPISMGQKHG